MTTASRTRLDSVRSGDVELFLRVFGDSGGTPLLILHGANYYDSRDWVDVAAELATDRAVAVFDLRGYGLSAWSQVQDYSLDAHMRDIEAILDRLGWERTVLVGHSRGGSLALRFAHERPSRVAGLMLVDFSPGQTPGRSKLEPLRTGPWGAVYASLEQAHAATSRNPEELRTDAGRARVEAIFAPRDGGWVNVRRDPAFRNERPRADPGWSSALQPLDLWDALICLADRGCPVLVIRATESSSYDAAALTRLRFDLPRIRLAEISSGHDVPGCAPAELVAAVRGFLSEQPV